MLKGLFSKPYSRIFIVGDNSGWVIDVEAQDLKSSAHKLGVKADIVRRMYLNLPQAVHYTSQFSLKLPDIYKNKNRLSVDYYHGKPDQDESFKQCFEALQKHHEQFGAVRVSTREMEGLIKSSGIDPKKVVRIPIGIDLNIFKPQTIEAKKISRLNLDIPPDAVVVGSFLKDGVGMGEGLEPKYIKGPDVFLAVIERLKNEIPNLWVLLSAPARGYVKKGLDKMNVPYRHQYFKDYKDIAPLYDALDMCLVTSREEGGPKACLESMAKGVPLVTTKVGQCADLVRVGENAMMAPIEAVDELSRLSLEVLRDQNLAQKLLRNGFQTAQENSLENQLPLWKQYFDKLIDS